MSAPLQKELIPLIRIRTERKKQKLRAEKGPDHVPGMPKAWVIYRYRDGEGWTLRGFSKRQYMNKRVVKKLRRQRRWEIRKKDTMKIEDLFTAAKLGPLASWSPPQRRATTRPDTIRTFRPESIETTALRIKAHERTVKESKYIAVGMLKDARSDVLPLYLGPLEASTLRSAEAEARRMFPIYKITALEIKKLPKRIKRGLRKGRIHPGFTRLKTDWAPDQE